MSFGSHFWVRFLVPKSGPQMVPSIKFIREPGKEVPFLGPDFGPVVGPPKFDFFRTILQIWLSFGAKFLPDFCCLELLVR